MVSNITVEEFKKKARGKLYRFILLDIIFISVIGVSIGLVGLLVIYYITWGFPVSVLGRVLELVLIIAVGGFGVLFFAQYLIRLMGLGRNRYLMAYEEIVENLYEKSARGEPELNIRDDAVDILEATHATYAPYEKPSENLITDVITKINNLIPSAARGKDKDPGPSN